MKEKLEKCFIDFDKSWNFMKENIFGIIKQYEEDSAKAKKEYKIKLSGSENEGYSSNAIYTLSILRDVLREVGISNRNAEIKDDFLIVIF